VGLTIAEMVGVLFCTCIKDKFIKISYLAPMEYYVILMFFVLYVRLFHEGLSYNILNRFFVVPECLVVGVIFVISVRVISYHFLSV